MQVTMSLVIVSATAVAGVFALHYMNLSAFHTG